MTTNLVSQPPLNVPFIDSLGRPSKAWQTWFRDLYQRTAFKGGNAIDNNSELIDDTIDTLEEAIIQILINVDDIQENSDNLSNHESLTEAHGSNGDIVGFNDIADEVNFGLVKRMVIILDLALSAVNITTPDIGTAPGTYNQAYTQSIADLTNECKASINALANDLNVVIQTFNLLLQRGKDANQMSTGPSVFFWTFDSGILPTFDDTTDDYTFDQDD